MIAGCPSCKTRFRIDDEKVGEEGLKLRCTRCRTLFRVMRKAAAPPAAAPAVPAAAPASPAVTPAAPAGTSVVIGHESAGFCRAVQGVLAAEPWEVHSFNDGIDVLEAIRRLRPQVALLDVALPRMFGFEICDAVRKDPALSGTKIILIAAIYDKTRYKRNPSSLYGADDYIEKHHIPDELVSKINRLVSAQHAVDSPDASEKEEDAAVTRQDDTPQDLERQEAARAEIRMDEESAPVIPAPPAREEAPKAAAPQQLPESHVKAKRLARIIVSDISLYNQGKVQEGVRNGNLFELLENDIQEGRSLYERRIPAEVREGTSFLEEAFDELIAKVRKELGA